MALADTIEAVRGGKPPEVARIESTKERTPFMERMLKAVKSAPERAVRKMAKIDDMDLPDDFNAAGGFARDVYKQLSDPVKAVWARGKEKSQMPMRQQAIEHMKDTGAILGGIAKAGGRIATSSVDAVQMAARNKVDPIEWEKVPILKNVPSYQRQAELKAERGVPMSQIITEAVRDISLDTLATYGTAKGLQHLDKKFFNKTKLEDVTKQIKSPLRGHGYDKLIKSGDMKVGDVYANPSKHILTPKAAKGIVTDYAGQLDTYRKGLGAELIKSINLKKVRYVDGQAPQVAKAAEKLLRDSVAQNASKVVATSEAMTGAVGKRPPYKRPRVDDYRPRTEQQAISASEDIVRRTKEAYLEGRVTRGHLKEVEREHKRLVELYKKPLE